MARTGILFERRYLLTCETSKPSILAQLHGVDGIDAVGILCRTSGNALITANRAMRQTATAFSMTRHEMDLNPWQTVAGFTKAKNDLWCGAATKTEFIACQGAALVFHVAPVWSPTLAGTCEHPMDPEHQGAGR
ncbi:hypothetical protein [Streptacidiphilus albus]|uniref:hypothetical protein n=1 Tax=Streptacidiphilus albus TaxID=105425 RepID=UPI00128CA43C|nr:hypothetical protein [Streptacidiphilus albus]